MAREKGRDSMEAERMTYDETREMLRKYHREMLANYEQNHPEASAAEKYDTLLREIFKLDLDPYTEDPRLLDLDAQHSDLTHSLDAILHNFRDWPLFQPEPKRSPEYQWTLDRMEELHASEWERYALEHPDHPAANAFSWAQTAILKCRVDPNEEDGQEFDRDAQFDFYRNEHIQFRLLPQ